MTRKPECAASPLAGSSDLGSLSTSMTVAGYDFGGLSIAVVIPCRDEEVAIAGVVNDFRTALPTSRIHVYDNASTDGTMEAAAKAGALVCSEPARGKGNVVRRMFGDIEADIFVMVDGDGTYPADRAPEMIASLIDGQLDMVSGARVPNHKAAYRPGHRLGNRAITFMVGLIFGRRFSDVLSGYRILTRRFVKSFPALSKGFEIETEIAVHALEMRLPCAEVEVPYSERPHGSPSKLRTIRDGISIVKTILLLIKEERPLEVFFLVFVLLEAAAVILSWPLLTEYLETGLVPRLPTAVLSTGLALLGFLSLACSLILDTVTLGRRETKRLRYLSLPGLPVHRARSSADGRRADREPAEQNPVAP